MAGSRKDIEVRRDNAPSLARAIERSALSRKGLVESRFKLFVEVPKIQGRRMLITGGDVCPPGGEGATMATGAILKSGTIHCTGTLVAPSVVLTAAHCLDQVEPAELTFLLGPSVHDPDVTSNVVEAYPHPDYDDDYNNDIAVLYLEASLAVTPARYRREPLPAGWSQSLMFAGYGLSDGVTNSGAGVRRCVYMSPAANCGPTFIYSTPGRNTCNADSGGPAFEQTPEGKRIAGITSFGDLYCEQYGVDTDVGHYASWIADRIAYATHL